MRLPRTSMMTRPVHVRDARLFVIATEGARTEGQYFIGFRHPRLHVEVLSTGPDGSSSPQHVLARMETFRGSYELLPDDELWLVLDVDRWGAAKLKDVCASSRHPFEVAVSNPCFELWLLLHFAPFDPASETIMATVAAAKGNNCKAIEMELRRLLPGYDKAKVRFEEFKPYVQAAIERAEALDITRESLWPEYPGTHVYRLVRRLHELLPR